MCFHAFRLVHLHERAYVLRVCALERGHMCVGEMNIGTAEMNYGVRWANPRKFGKSKKYTRAPLNERG